MSEFAALIQGIDEASGDGHFRIKAFANTSSYLAARSPTGGLALLTRCSTEEPLLPIRLAGIEARYGVRCLLRDDQRETEERLSIVECLATDPQERQFFCGCADQLIALLGPFPTTSALGQAIDRLVAMFRALSQPARTDVVGLLGELCAVYAAADVSEAIRAWRLDPKERFDFVAGRLRLDVKATSGPDRVHHLSALQATPPHGTVGAIASFLVSMSSGGTSVEELMRLIGDRLGSDDDGVFRLREAVSLAMGASLRQALQARFDFQATLQSMQFFDAATVPALRPPFPDGVSDVRFRTDLDQVVPISVNQLRRQLDAKGQAVLPSRASNFRR